MSSFAPSFHNTSSDSLIWPLAYWLAVAILAVFLVTNAGFGLVDDYGLFDPALIHGHWRLFWGDGTGRFFPLNGKEYFILNELGIRNPSFFYAVQAAKLGLCAWLLVSLLRREGASKAQAYLTSLIILSTPAFLVAISRLFIADVSSFTLFLLMLRFAPGTESQRVDWRFWLSLLAANLAFYHKEPGFMAVGSMAVLLYVSARQHQAKVLQKYCLALVASTCLYVLTYYGLAYRFVGAQNYASHRSMTWPDFVGFLLGNDTLLLAVLPWLAWGMCAFVRKHRQFDLAQAALVGSLAYVFAFFVLRITSAWYLLPAYAFAVPALGQALFRARHHNWSKSGMAACLVLALLVVQSVAGGLYLLSFNKAATSGTSAMLDFLASQPLLPDGQKTTILVPRVEKESEVVSALKTMFAAKGLDQRFDLRYGKSFELSREAENERTLTLVTPFTPLSDQNMIDLHRGMRQLFASDRAVRDYSLAGTWLPWLFSGASWHDFIRHELWLHGQSAIYGPATGGQGASLDPSTLHVQIEPTAKRVCPVGPTHWTLLVRNASDTDMEFDHLPPLDRPVIILITARPGEKMRVVGNVAFPDRIKAGESVRLAADFAVNTTSPAVVTGFLGISRGQFIYLADSRKLFEGNFKPTYGACFGQ